MQRRTGRTPLFGGRRTRAPVHNLPGGVAYGREDHDRPQYLNEADRHRSLPARWEAAADAIFPASQARPRHQCRHWALADARAPTPPHTAKASSSNAVLRSTVHRPSRSGDRLPRATTSARVRQPSSVSVSPEAGDASCAWRIPAPEPLGPGECSALHRATNDALVPGPTLIASLRVRRPSTLPVQRGHHRPLSTDRPTQNDSCGREVAAVCPGLKGFTRRTSQDVTPDRTATLK